MFTFFTFLLLPAVLISPSSTERPALVQITPPVTHAECPSWDPRTGVLLFADVWAGVIYRYNFSSDTLSSLTVNGAVAPIVQSKSDPDLLIVGLDRSVAAVQWGMFPTTKILTTVSDDRPDSYFNDGKADKQGRIWFGTKGDSDGQGSLYKISRETLLHPEEVIAPVDVSNGMAWNRANDKFFYIDSPTRQVFVYDYDDKNGTITNKRVAFDLEKNGGIAGDSVPDGMTIDRHDNLWIALWGGGSVIKVNSTNGELLERHPIPATYVTSVMWGGPQLDILFVTTSRMVLSEEQLEQQPGAGSVYALFNLNSSGLPVYQADIVDSI